MQLSSVYLYEKIKEKYEITERGTLSGSDGYLRPFLRCGISKEGKKSEDGFRTGHVYVIQGCDANECEPVNSKAENIFWIFCKRKDFVGERKLMLHQKSFSRFRIFILHLIVWKK